MKINNLIYFITKKKLSGVLLMSDNFRKFCILFILLAPLANCILAQGPPPGVGAGTTPTGFENDTLLNQDTEIDTAHIRYFYPDNSAQSYPENDTLLNQYFHQFDPARRRQNDYFNLGRVTSAAYPSVYQPMLKHGLDVGIHAFDIYYIKNENLRFYQQGKAFTDVFYSGSEQENGLIKARFARNFANGINFSVDYQRAFNINQLNSSGPIFNRTIPAGSSERWLYEGFPRGRVSALAVGLWIHRTHYDGYLTYTTNSSSQLDFGGITHDSLFRLPSPTDAFAPILTEAQSQHRIQELSYLHYLKLNRTDSTGTKRQFLATHKINYRAGLYKSYDKFGQEPTPQDSLFYGALLNDARGLRFYLNEKNLENTVTISTTKARTNNDSIRKITGQNDWFEVGITHAYHHINLESLTRQYNNIIAKGRWHFTPNDNVKVATYAHFNVLGYNLGDYRLNGEIYFNIKNIGSLTVKAVNQLYEATYLQQEAYLTQKKVWENDFKKTLETSLSGTLTIPRLRFEGTIAYTLLNNTIFFDKTLTPQQASTPLSIIQLMVNQNFAFKNFHFDNTIALQKTTEKFIRLPDVYSKNSLYIEGKIFKKAMLARLGFDARYATAWFAPAYMPLTGQFYVQETDKVKSYPAVDVFMSFKVKSFRLFAKIENLIGSFYPDVYFQTYNYPVPDRQFRFGVRWNLVN